MAGKKVGGKPDFDATVIGHSGRRWTGADQLPASGTLPLKNTDDQPHFLSMVQVVPGTTVDQVLEALQSDEQPPWVLPGGADRRGQPGTQHDGRLAAARSVRSPRCASSRTRP